MLAALERLFRDQPANTAEWHRWWTFFPVRLTDGRWSWSNGQLWRRRTSLGWEYRRDEETDDQWDDRAW